MISPAVFKENERKQFGLEFRQFVSSLNITQTELALTMGVSQKTVSNCCSMDYIPSDAFMRRFFKKAAVQYELKWIQQAFSSYLTYKNSKAQNPEEVLEKTVDHFALARESLVKGIVERLECRSSELSVEALLKIVAILTDEVD